VCVCVCVSVSDFIDTLGQSSWRISESQSVETQKSWNDSPRRSQTHSQDLGRTQDLGRDVPINVINEDTQERSLSVSESSDIVNPMEKFPLKTVTRRTECSGVSTVLLSDDCKIQQKHRRNTRSLELRDTGFVSVRSDWTEYLKGTKVGMYSIPSSLPLSLTPSLPHSLPFSFLFLSLPLFLWPCPLWRGEERGR
jgi:hypothetical protein